MINIIQLILIIRGSLALHGPGYIDPTPQDSKADTIIEKVYLHTDRNYYYSGEDIWFKAYLIDASENMLTDNSNNLHVDLISPVAEIVDSRLVRIENGLGKGDFSLPKDLSPGKYRLRAYTNYMRNFGNELFFYKQVTIVNSPEFNDKSDKSVSNQENIINISFYPEGGSLVDNVSSIVAFKAIDSQGKGCDVSGDIYSSEGKKITSFKSVHQGMGSFILKPAPGLHYSAEIKKIPGPQIKSELPKSLSTGITGSILKDESDNLILIIKTNPLTLPLIRNQDLILNISERNITLKSIVFRIRSLHNKIKIPSEDFPDGILKLTVSSASQNTALCERLLFHQNNNDINLQIETGKINFKERDSVSIKVKFDGDPLIGEKAFLSLSASGDISDTGPQFPQTISSWFLLESDVRGPVEEPTYYFDPSNPNRIKDLDLLLLTQGWRDFEWKNENMNFLPERGFTMSGRLRKLLVDKPLPDSKITFGLIQPESNLVASVITDSLGRFSLPGLDFEGDLTLFATAVNGKEKISGKIILDSADHTKPDIENYYSENGLHSEEKLLPVENEITSKNNISKKLSDISDIIELEEVKVISEKTDAQSIKIKQDRLMYRMPDNELIVTPQLENYSNALEMIRGRIPGVEIFGTGPETKVIIRGISSVNGGTEPLFLIDGAVTTLDQILNLPVFVIDRVDILKGNSTAIYGMRGGAGVIAIITRVANRMTEVNNASQSVQIKISGYDAPRIFYSPHLASNSSQNILFWEPDITLEHNESKTLNYFSANNSSSIKVTVEGITSQGIPVSAKAAIIY